MPCPAIDQIDPAQLPHVGYNPTISALNLNFNRVFFEWEREGEGYTVRMDARSDSHSPMVTVSRMTIEARDYPIYTFDRTEARDEWTVARSALAMAVDVGCRCAARLPTWRRCSRCRPAVHGIALGTPVFSESAPPNARILVEHASPTLEVILRGMMRWSTNLTAEVVGLSATQAGGVRPATLAESGDEMSAWMRDTLGARQARFVDHSGLGVNSRLRAP
jgi:D-alanyl-D-alanine carboxypeptidase/D-alanyl-D-alanine-endopeptidase (penicillin-binding protein 4)